MGALLGVAALGSLQQPAASNQAPLPLVAPHVVRDVSDRTIAAPLPTIQTPSRTRPFRNCAQARRAGRSMIPLGDPAYAPWLDRDRDGIACEPKPRRRHRWQ
ncbi:MAG: excalibur calcium-binding domain-containing protein [Acetobacteraceae bacterium]